jgi:hypothetical protein
MRDGSQRLPVHALAVWPGQVANFAAAPDPLQCRTDSSFAVDQQGEPK